MNPLLDALDDVFFTFDERGRFRRWNRAVVEMTGYEDEELASMGPVDFFEGEDAERVASAIADVFETGRGSVEASLVTSDGERIPHEFRAVRVDEGSGFCGIGRDITDRRASERERKTVLDRMTDAFFRRPRVAAHLRQRPGRRHPLGGRGEGTLAAEVVDLNLWEEIPGAVGTTFYEAYHEAMRTQEAVSFREQYEPLGRWFDVRAYPSETGLSVFFRDVTEQQRRREELESRERVLRDLYNVTSDVDRSFDDQVEALMDIGGTVLDTEYATLSRVEDETYVFEAVRSPDDEVEVGDTVPLSFMFCERAVATERTLVFGDVASDLAERDGHTEWVSPVTSVHPCSLTARCTGRSASTGRTPTPNRSPSGR